MWKPALVLIFAIYAPLAVWLHHSYEPSSDYVLPQPFRPVDETGLGFALTAIDSRFFEPNDRYSQKFALYENDKPLGPIAEPVDVNRLGQGRYAHWWSGGSRFVFSSSDNTDPRTNGRVYSVKRMIKSP